MAHRRGDTAPHSSADAYRALPSASLSPSHAHAHARPLSSARANSSGDEDALLVPIPAPVPAPHTHTPAPLAASFVRTRTRSRRDSSSAESAPLDPPRPPFLARTDPRRSWSASSAASATDADPASDSERDAASVSAAGIAGVGAAGVRQSQSQSQSQAPRPPARGAERPRSQTQPQPQPAVRARNHHRRRSAMANEYAYASDGALVSPREEVGAEAGLEPMSVPADPFGTPRSSVYGVPEHTASSGSPSSGEGMNNAVGEGARVNADADADTNAGPNPNVNPNASPSANSNMATAGKERARAPPSAYPFPFQSHPGNPDPGTPIPGVARRASLDSLHRGPGASAPPPAPSSTANAYLPSPGYPVSPSAFPGAGGYGLVHGGPVAEHEELGRPYAPFMGPRSATPPSPGATGGQSQLYRNSAAAAATVGNVHANVGGASMYADSGATGLPRTASVPAIAMRAPFLSPASRPTSSLWSPPSFPYPHPHPYPYEPAQASSSSSALQAGASYASRYPSYADIHAHLRKGRRVLPSSRLAEKVGLEDKPWMGRKDWRTRTSWWLTIAMMCVGVAGAAVLCYFGWTDVVLLKDSELCMVLDEEFDSLDLNGTWAADVELGGFGNGEFQMTTTKSKNLYVSDGQLYIMPTLTSDEIGEGSIFNGYTYDLGGACTTKNQTACSVTSNNDTGTVVNPVQSARISTQQSYSIKYGRIEVSAKLPTGDWLWPAIWMLPVNNTYGVWPMSGEIDIMEARGNGLDYTAQGSNYVRASLNYGVLDTVQTHLFGWWSEKRSSFADGFHTYALEWTEDWMRLYVDTRLHAMMNVRIQGRGGKSFWDRGNYPATAMNGSATEVVVQNIWQENGGTAAAPYDQPFYLILDLAAGGTSGWFPDNVGGKPWYDGSGTAMQEFANAQGTWSATWPSDADDRAFRIDSVKMWKLGSC
ncbi:hypothetical protein AcW1_010027 [Taiwanofungus camphoratus]|nr:hypothetical protein AcW1_010027 [Antrodia cinnamomea]